MFGSCFRTLAVILVYLLTLYKTCITKPSHGTGMWRPPCFMNTLLELPGADVGGLRNGCVMATLLITLLGRRTLKSHPLTFCPNYSLERRHKQHTIAGMEGVKIGNYSVRTSSSLGTLYFHRKIPAAEKPFRV